MSREKRNTTSSASNVKRKVRYAVVGLGYIAQTTALPAFGHSRNSELAALISDDPEKLKKLSKEYRVPST